MCNSWTVRIIYKHTKQRFIIKMLLPGIWQSKVPMIDVVWAGVKLPEYSFDMCKLLRRKIKLFQNQKLFLAYSWWSSWHKPSFSWLPMTMKVVTASFHPNHNFLQDYVELEMLVRFPKTEEIPLIQIACICFNWSSAGWIVCVIILHRSI